MDRIISNVVWDPVPIGLRSDKKVVYYDYGVSCGLPRDSFNPAPGILDFNDYCAPNPDAVFGVRAEGDSMEPLIRDRDLLVVNHERKPVDGDVVVATVDGEHLVKVYTYDSVEGTITLSPLNPRYKPLVIRTAEKDVRIDGVVERFIHNMKRQMELITINTQPKLQASKNKVHNIHCSSQQGWIACGSEVEYADGVIPETNMPPVDATTIIQKLERYFSPSFRGRNVAKTDYLPMLADDILAIRKRKKDIARLANMIYNSKAMVARPDSFAEWYRTFCQHVGAAHVPAYRQSKVDDYAKLSNKFYYLMI